MALDELQQAIVDSVNDMIILTAREEHFCKPILSAGTLDFRTYQFIFEQGEV